MSGVNVVLILIYIFLTVLSSFCFEPRHRWKGLLFISIGMYWILIGSKLLAVTCIAIATFLFAKLVKKEKINLIIPILIGLLPMIVAKSLDTENHFNSFFSNNRIYLDNADWKQYFNVLGLSYITFNCLSYLIDVKRKYIEPESNVFKFMLYVFFFPTVFSGPLHRYKFLSEQFTQVEVTNRSISKGGRLILFGLFKMVLSQRMFVMVKILENSDLKGPVYLLVGTTFFLFLYLSFSSFIDFFRGVAKIIGIDTKQNFKPRIYLSSSRQEFWSGWHITLNKWFRDYFFFPLAKKDKKRLYVNWCLLLTFLLIALWHGFTINLAIWGIANGVWIILEKKVNINWPINDKLKKLLGLIYHLGISSLLALIFISSSLSDTAERLLSISHFPSFLYRTFFSNLILTMICFGIVDYHYAKAKGLTFDVYMGHKPVLNRWLIYVKLILLILVFGNDLSLDNYYNQF